MNKKVHLLKYCEETIFIFNYFILALHYILDF